MDRAQFTSADFSCVPHDISAELPERLLHRDVLRGSVAGDNAFSEVRNHLVRVVDLPSRVLSVTIGGLEVGQTTRRHRHNYETVIYVLEGRGVSLIGEREVHWQSGDAFYVPPWAWHNHRNNGSGPATYIACENAPLLQNLGVAVREEA
ncbi:MAG: cupin domain-containing protein [Ramlibacter sp.]|nr:cupin domain-containing protein [Ramlibacter sp.]